MLLRTLSTSFISSSFFSIAALGGYNLYTAEDYDAFHAALAASHTETFEEAAEAWDNWGDPAEPLFDSSGNGFSFGLETGEGSVLHGYPWAFPDEKPDGSDGHNWEGSGMRNAPETEEDSAFDTPLTIANISFDDGPVTAIGGEFFYTHGTGEFVLDSGIRDMTLVVESEGQGALEVTHAPSNHDEAFFGVTTSEENPITGLTFTVDPGGGNRYTTTSEITVGAIPEPATISLIAGAAAAGMVIAVKILLKTPRRSIGGYSKCSTTGKTPLTEV